MFFTIKTPQSKRFIRFITGNRGFDKGSLIGLIGTFTKSLFLYLLSRVGLLAVLFYKLLSFISYLPKLAKRELVRKLIWSRGRLGRPVATAAILSFSLFVFFAGEFLSGFEIIVTAQTKDDYLSSPVDMLAKKEITTTQIPDIRKRTEPFEYTVEGGDTLYGIGEKFKVSVDALKYVNNLTDNSILAVGSKVSIPPSSGLVHTVKSGDTLNSIELKYEVASQAIADFNYLLDTSKLTVGAELVIPGAKIPTPVIPVYISPDVVGPANYGSATPSKGFCVWPTTVRIITQYFSWYHNGADIATPWSGGMPPIFSCTGGKVTRAGWDPWGLGLHVRIDHGNGYETVYGHMSRIDVGYGQRVGRGQQIGLMGNTGRSTGPHVHFTVKFNGVAQNPFSYTN